MVIPKDPPGHYNQEGITPSALKLTVKMTQYQPQQSNNAPDDDNDEVVPIPHDMFDIDPVPAIVEKWTKI